MTTTEGAIPRTAVYRRSEQLVCREVGGESILVPIRHNVGDLDFVYTLSPVAARVWTLLDGVHTLDDVVRILTAEFDVAPETAYADAAELLADLESAALVAQVNG